MNICSYGQNIRIVVAFIGANLQFIHQSWINSKYNTQIGGEMNPIGSSNSIMSAFSNQRRLMHQDSEQRVEKQSDQEKQKFFDTVKHSQRITALRNLFLYKLKRTIVPREAPRQKRQKKNRLYLCRIKAISLPEHIIHIIFVLNLLILLVLFVLSAFDGFINGFKTGKNQIAVLVLKIICISVTSIYFLMRCTVKTVEEFKNFQYIFEVVRSYALSKEFYLDLLTVMFQIFIFCFPDLMAISGVFFYFLIFQLLAKLQTMVHVETAHLKSEKWVIVWGLVKICFGNIIVAHILAAMLVGMSRLNDQENWLIKYGAENDEWWQKYFLGFYWGATIMMTVGFGDITPANSKEVVIVSFLEMSSCIILGYNISEIGHLISLLREKNQIVNKKLATFRRMLRSRPKLSPTEEAEFLTLQKGIYHYIKQLDFESSNMEFQLRNNLLQQLPEHLKKGFFHFINQKMFSSCLFFNKLKQDTLKRLARRFEGKYFHTGENLVQQGQNIFILEEGIMGFAYRKKGSTMNGFIFDTIDSDKNIDSVLLTTKFLGRDINYQLIAKSHCVVWSISFQELLQILAQNQYDNQNYFMLLHTHQLSNDQWVVKQCRTCLTPYSRHYHYIFNCPKVTYMPLRMNAAKRHCFADLNKACKRVPIARKKRTRMHRYSALIHKRKELNHVIERLNYQSRFFEHVLQETQNQVFQKKGQREQEPVFPHQLTNSVRKEIFELCHNAIRFHQTGYEDGFWNLQMDSAYSFQYYFPAKNPHMLDHTDFWQLESQVIHKYKMPKSLTRS